jgi:hypothetical protein
MECGVASWPSTPIARGAVRVYEAYGRRALRIEVADEPDEVPLSIAGWQGQADNVRCDRVTLDLPALDDLENLPVVGG